MIKNRILIVDDMRINRMILLSILSNDYETLEAENGLDALEIVMSQPNDVAVILLDVMMPKMNGFEVLEILKSNPLTRNIEILLITAAKSVENELRAFKLGASDFITKPFAPDIIKARVTAHVELRNYRTKMNTLVANKIRQMEHIQEAVTDLLANIVEYRDAESGFHIKRTRNLVKLLIEKVMLEGKLDKSFNPSEINFVVNAVTLHDIGKIGIPDEILLKPGKLTSDEFEIMKTHTWVGAEIAKQLINVQDPAYVKHIQDICLYHHEKWDGTGYPIGLSGDETPYSARLMAIVDVYDALITKRIYKAAFMHEQTVKIIAENSGQHFDPTLVDVFIKYNEDFRQLAEIYKD